MERLRKVGWSPLKAANTAGASPVSDPAPATQATGGGNAITNTHPAMPPSPRSRSPRIQPPYRIFISYTSEDGALASAIHKSLASAFSQIDLRVDLMKEFQPGTEWRKEIDDCLTDADLLLLVYTGQLKPSHSWTGYEVGFFSSEIKKRAERFPDVPREIIPINFLRPADPAMEVIEGIEFRESDVTRPDITISQLAVNPDTFIATLDQARKKGVSDQLFGLFHKIADNIERCSNRPTQNQERFERDEKLRAKVSGLYKDLHSILRHRQKDDIGLQSKIIVTLTSEEAGELENSALSASIEFQNQAEDVFHLSDSFLSHEGTRRMTWTAFEAALLARNDSQLASLWVANLRELIRSAHSGLFIDNDLLVPSWDQAKTYRAVVTRRVRFYSGRVDIHIYLFELFKREDFGDPKTSIFLNAVAVACRYRSLFLEPESPFAPQWMRPYHGNKLRHEVMRMIRQLDLVHQDSLRSGLNSKKALTEIYGMEGASVLPTVARDWVDAERELRKKSAELVHCTDETGLTRIKEEFHQQLVQFCKTTNTVNADYLNRALRKLDARNAELLAKLESIIRDWESSMRASAASSAPVPAPGATG